ncbi:hypothetical protein AALO_G00059510 [Alosa alosa]|uniref:Uncharacterized protein n=1 Tax=Alosa alosa TaxID=278164 RepID=A0AAV6HBB8_9TELE|nr:hypothetical protein AALO_G00059510 [Alosa alosa]
MRYRWNPWIRPSSMPLIKPTLAVPRNHNSSFSCYSRDLLNESTPHRQPAHCPELDGSIITPATSSWDPVEESDSSC